jgi:hypothetical protein
LLSILLTVALTLTEDSLVCSRAVLTKKILHSLDLFGGVRLRPVVSIIGTNFRDWCRRVLDPPTKDALDGEEFYLHGQSQYRSSKGNAQLPARCASINREMLRRWTKIIQEYYRQMRKFGCSILAVVQQYDIIKESAVRAR